MKNEKVKLVIEITKEMEDWIKNGFPDKDTLDASFALEAIKQGKRLSEVESSSDCISREAVLKKWNETSTRGRTEFDQVILCMPPVGPQETKEKNETEMENKRMTNWEKFKQVFNIPQNIEPQNIPMKPSKGLCNMISMHYCSRTTCASCPINSMHEATFWDDEYKEREEALESETAVEEREHNPSIFDFKIDDPKIIHKVLMNNLNSTVSGMRELKKKIDTISNPEQWGITDDGRICFCKGRKERAQELNKLWQEFSQLFHYAGELRNKIIENSNVNDNETTESDLMYQKVMSEDNK